MYRQLKLINKPTMNLNITPKKILMIKNKLNLILAVFTAFFLVSCENDTTENNKRRVRIKAVFFMAI